MSTPRYAAPGKSFDCLVDFYRNSAYSAFPQEHRASGSLGLRMMRARQDSFDLIGAALPDLVVTLAPMSDVSEVLFDHGDGAKRHRARAIGPAEIINVSPVMTEERVFVADPHEVMTAALPGAVVHRILDQHGLADSSYLRYVGELTPDTAVIRTMKALWRASGGDAAAGGLYVDALTLQLLAQLCDDRALSPTLDDRADVRIARAVDYVEAHLADTLSVTTLAAVAAMSAGHFSRRFKATTGEPVWAYVQRRRCERAKQLLLHSREPLAEIACRAGFASQAHMTTSLKERYGATPGVIRQERT